jgi:hypothetical protein
MATSSPQQDASSKDVNKIVPSASIAKGRSVSGRSWKFRQQSRASSLVTKTPQNNASTSWEQKKAEREARKVLVDRERELKEEKRQQAILKKERKIEQEKRRMENEFRAASRSAQMLGKNADRKMKAMNKKQLRQIKKTRINNKTGAVEFVGAYTK